MGALICGRPPSVNCQQRAMLSKLYTGLLVIVALFAMAALGMLMLVVIMHIGDLAISTNNPAGMNH